MKQTFFFKRQVCPSDWSALPRRFLAGESVDKFIGHTYGLDRDDFIHLGVETIPCTVHGSEGFFTVPVDMLEDENGKSPMGAYMSFKK